MADIPITREEKYLAYLTGDYKADIPKPITRRERYLYELCLKGMGGEISPEEIKNAVNEYLEKNPVKPGATTEQAAQIEQNKKDVASLKEDISTKITKFYASSQGETNLQDSDDGKIMDMMVYGKSEQKQYSGKNLLNATLQTTTLNGITCTSNGDGTYTLNGKLSSNIVFTLFSGSLSIGNKSKIILMKNDTFADLGIVSSYCAFKISSSWDDAINYPTIKEIPSGKIVQTINLVLRLSNSESPVTLANVLIKPMIVDVEKYPDTTYDDFEPYTGGIPSPNPDYPQEIKSVVNPTVKVCGKNLLKATLRTTTANGITCTENGDGTYVLNGTASDDTRFIVGTPLMIQSRKYKVCGCPIGGSISNYYIAIAGDLPDYGEGNVGLWTSHTATWEYRIYVKKGTVCNNLTFKPMLTTDLTATYDDFEPHHEQTVTLPYTLNAIPVSAGGNVTIDGQQYIADYVDVERGKLVRNVLVAKFTGVENWTYNDASDDLKKRFFLEIGKKIKKTVGMSNYLRNLGINISSGDNGFIAYTKSVDVRITSTVSLAEFKNLLGRLNSSGNPLNIFLALDTPEENDLTPEEIAALKALATYYPTTNISVNSEQLDGYTVFNYPISMENGWNYVKQQIGDTRDYIYDMDARTQDTDLQAAEAYVNSEYAVALTELEV